MAYAKLECSALFHPRLAGMSQSAWGLWSKALAWAKHDLTNGWIDRAGLKFLGATKPQIRQLVERGLWIEQIENGIKRYLIHDYFDYNLSRKEVENRREKNRDSKRKSRSRNHNYLQKSAVVIDGHHSDENKSVVRESSFPLEEVQEEEKGGDTCARAHEAGPVPGVPGAGDPSSQKISSGPAPATAGSAPTAPSTPLPDPEPEPEDPIPAAAEHQEENQTGAPEDGGNNQAEQEKEPKIWMCAPEEFPEEKIWMCAPKEFPEEPGLDLQNLGDFAATEVPEDPWAELAALENRRAQLPSTHENLPLEASQWAKPATGGTHTPNHHPNPAQRALGHVEGTNPADWSTPEDPRCRNHAGLPREQVPACHGCARAREWFKQRDHTEKQNRKAAINACDLCDHLGMITVTDSNGHQVVAHCDHTGEVPLIVTAPPEPRRGMPSALREQLQARWSRHQPAASTKNQAPAAHQGAETAPTTGGK